MNTTEIACTLVGAATRHRSIGRRVGGRTVLLDLWLANWTAGFRADAPLITQR